MAAIVQAGKSQYQIVRSARSSAVDAHAARVLQGALFKMTGVRLPVRWERQRLPHRPAILIGSGRDASEPGLWDRDSYEIVPEGGDLILRGAAGRGTHYAVHGIDCLVADSGENVTEAYRSDPMKTALVQMQAVFAQLEKSIIVKKLRKAREAKRERTGQKVEGQKAFGEYDPKHMARYEQELATVKRIRELRDHRRSHPGSPAGKRMGYLKISRVLDAEGHPTRRGGKWNPGSVKKVIDGDVYRDMGKRSSKKGTEDDGEAEISRRGQGTG